MFFSVFEKMKKKKKKKRNWSYKSMCRVSLVLQDEAKQTCSWHTWGSGSTMRNNGKTLHI